MCQAIRQPATSPLSEEHRQLVSLVVKAVDVEMIHLLGTAYRQQIVESIFSSATQTVQCVNHYYLLVLIKSGKESKNRVQDKIENNLQHYRPTTAIVLEIETFARWLQDGHSFASQVNQNATLLYNGGGYEFGNAKEVNEEVLRKQNNQCLSVSRQKVQAFLAGADLFTLRKDYKMAAFMLHQAAEQTLLSLFLINTGFSLNTHNLDKLLRYCSMFLPQLLALFPRETEKDKRLFSLLQKAYIDARYQQDFTISYADLVILNEQVSRLKEWLHEIQ